MWTTGVQGFDTLPYIGNNNPNSACRALKSSSSTPKSARDISASAAPWDAAPWGKPMPCGTRMWEALLQRKLVWNALDSLDAAKCIYIQYKYINIHLRCGCVCVVPFGRSHVQNPEVLLRLTGKRESKACCIGTSHHRDKKATIGRPRDSDRWSRTIDIFGMGWSQAWNQQPVAGCGRRGWEQLNVPMGWYTPNGNVHFILK